ncbi:uncharacterized protein [Primulina eburnea]|uniref:uncharacterized protein isoform X3 n=1 Tax=Primulina eburnea TaxID=1245227 RepID=UPI003C6C054A
MIHHSLLTLTMLSGELIWRGGSWRLFFRRQLMVRSIKVFGNGIWLSFGTLWVIDLESNSIREAVKESSKILEICGQMMMDKSIFMRHVPSDWAGQQLAATYSFDGIPYPGLMSSIATFQDHIVCCDTVVKFDRGTGSAINFPFSNFGVLGLPYWFVPPLEQVYSHGGVPGLELDHVQEFNLFRYAVYASLHAKRQNFLSLLILICWLLPNDQQC